MKPSKRSDGRYQLRKQSNGIMKSFYGKTAKECIEKANRWDGAPVVAATCKISMDAWMDSEVSTKSNATQGQYKYLMTHITPLLGSVRVSKVLPLNCQSVINKMHKSGLSTTTMRHARKVMHTFFEYERKMKKSIRENPCVDLTIPQRKTARPRRAATPEELSIIWNRLEGTHYYYCFQFLLMTGLRPSEACGVKLSNIKGNQLLLDEARTRLDVSSGKSLNATRKIEISPVALDLINMQLNYLKTNNIKFNDYIFPNRDGFPSHSGLLTVTWCHLLADTGVKLALYELRHTFVSIMIDQMPIKDLQRYIGHSTTMDSTGTYGHIFSDTKRNGEMIDEKISPYLVPAKNCVKNCVKPLKIEKKIKAL